MNKKAKLFSKQIEEFALLNDLSWFTLNHLHAFSIVCDKQPIMLRDLCSDMTVEKSTVNRIVWSLCSGLPKSNKRHSKQADLLRVIIVPEDMRQREITLTMKGTALRNKMFSEEDDE